MQLVDVLNKLRELEKTNESVKDAIDSAKRMNGEDNLTEAQRLYSVKLENDKGVTKNVRVKAGSEQEAKDSATMDPKFKAVSARVVDAPADDEEDDDLEESFEQGVAEDSLNEDPVIQFASKAHDEWRKNFDPTGTKERIKKNSDGTEGNINVPFEELHPDWKKENLAAGQAAMMAVKRFPNNIEQAAEYIHNEWMKRNPKADYNAAQHIAYDQLPEDEKEKDRVHVRTMMALSGKQGVAEGLKDIATELGQVADNKDYETLRDLISSEGEIGKYLGDMITDFSAEKGLHPDDDEELEKLVMDRLIHEFGNQFDEAATTEELNQIRKLSGFAEAKLDPVGKEDDDLNNDGEVDSTDDYLKNRREKIAKSMKESVDLTECGMMPENMGMMHNTPATVTMTATASSGSEVSSMLKDILTLAGQRSHADAYVMDGGCSMEEDGGFAAATSSPNEFEASVEQQLQQGDDMHKPHEQHAAMAKLGDNPMASEDVDQLAESLWQQFNATK